MSESPQVNYLISSDTMIELCKYASMVSQIEVTAPKSHIRDDLLALSRVILYSLISCSAGGPHVCK